MHASTITFGSCINLSYRGSPVGCNRPSNNPVASGLPRIAVSRNNVYVVWENNTAGNEDVLFRASTNNGTSFGSSVKLSTTLNGDASDPEVATAGSSVYVVWQANVSSTENDVFFRASTNNGTSFGSAIDLCSSSSCGGIGSVTNSYVPDVAAAGNNVTVIWFTETAGSHGTTLYNILTKTSTTSGSNLGTVTAITLTTKAYTATDAAAPPQILAQGKYLYATWSVLVSSSGPAETYFAASTNGFSTFTTAPNSISSAPTGESDIYQALAAAGNSVYVAWTNDTVNSDNTMFRASANNGASFGALKNLYEGPFTDLNPELAASGNNAYVVWANGTAMGAQVLYKSSSNNGASFGSIINLSNVPVSSSQQMIAVSGANVYVAWAESLSGTNDLFFTSSSDNGVTFGTAQDLSPTIGNSLTPEPVIGVAGSNVYLAWEDDTRGNGDIFFRGSPPSSPDVAISGITVSRAFAYSGALANPVIVNVNASNPGPVTASFVVSAKANSTFIAGNQTVTNLPPGGWQLLQFNWTTGTLARGNYTLTAYASQVTPVGETNLANNVLTWSGLFQGRLNGDVNGDCKVNIFDLTGVAGAFGSTAGSLGFNSAADLNNDSKINIFDLSLVGSNFGSHC